MSSDDELDIASFQRNGTRKRSPPARKSASVSPGMFFSDESSVTEEDTKNEKKKDSIDRPRKLVAVKVTPVRNREEYTYYEPEEEVHSILREYKRKGVLMYEVKLLDGKHHKVTFDELISTQGGLLALEALAERKSSGDSSNNDDMRLRQKTQSRVGSFVDITTLDLSESDSSSYGVRQSNRRASKTRAARSSTKQKQLTDFFDDSSSEESSKKRRRKRKQPQAPTRRSDRGPPRRKYEEVEETGSDESSNTLSDSESVDILRSDIYGGARKRKRGSGARSTHKELRTGTRQSERSTRAQNNMREAGMGDIYRSDSEPKQAAPKTISVREVFETLPRSNLFRSRHVEGCEVCSEGPGVAPLIYCQGCSLSYHKNCIGNRATRDHLVTKIDDDNYVLQCKRCINFYQKKDPIAPDLSMCQDCKRKGVACRPFRARKTTQQELKEREENGGYDPIIDVNPELLNNAANVLFRCTKCSRAYHYHHLPPISAYSMDVACDDEEKADERFQEYSRKWLCKECDDTAGQKVSAIIAWRPTDVEAYRPGVSCGMLSENDKSYLIKWDGQSYFRASWHSGAWTWGSTASAMRKAFYKREQGPKMRTEDAIPEEYLRIDIVLDVKYTSYVEVRNQEIDKARIKEVDKALIKYKGLGYEDTVWEKVPTPEDGDRWVDFVTAYNDWVAGRYIKYPKQGPLKARIDKARETPFSKLEKEKQPENVVGGELMKYQIDGLNWIYYQWYSQKNGILADEMGLGKTIQVISFMAALIHEHNCFPFLIVVPNSTVPNWRREIKQWVPSLRVVAYFGSSTAREMAYKYELYPHGTKELRAHVVVTSYEAASDDSSRKILRGINWAGLIVDEGQRLKNDKSQLYGALTSAKAPFRLLLTGTPLQNNARELFNLLQFLDETINAAELEEKYSEMTSENIRELHDQIRPFILRRTKVQVLTFLPPLGQVIVPLSMSHLQKELYKSILAKNPELLKTLFTTAKSVKAQERANLNNLLMQLRKCLCHPFVYSREIEERTDIAAVSHRNLVEASAKLQFLELLLPKLKERGHRVLIFSQFLDMLDIMEDFLDGMQMAYQRLDGSLGSLEKQKRIDQFNAPDSPLFAFLLSTRAGGVGINLATADTVLILDPDFNPHQDIQAIARAHRIGQKNKVLCFQLMSRASAEEKIVQIGRKKMALDHAIVEQLDAEDIEVQDVESILKHGAAELFGDRHDHDIRYDEASIDKLLDRSQIENTKTSADNSAESQFSFARVWANNEGALEDSIDIAEEEVAPDPGVWDKILKERQAAAAAEALLRADALGKGKRARMTVNYKSENDAVPDALDSSNENDEPKKKSSKRKAKKPRDSGSDTDYQDYSEEESEDEALNQAGLDTEDTGIAKAQPGNKPSMTSMTATFSAAPPKAPHGPTSIAANPQQIKPNTPMQRQGIPSQKAKAHNPAVKPFVRAQLPLRAPLDPTYDAYRNQLCFACQHQHPQGACPLKIAGAEHCGLCGLAHFGQGRTCPHIRSETQVRDMLEALKNSPENKNLVDAAVRYLRGVKGTLVQGKKKEREKVAARGQQGAPTNINSNNPLKPPPVFQSNGPPAFQTGQFHANPGIQFHPDPRQFLYDPSRQNTGPPPAAPSHVGSYTQGQRIQLTHPQPSDSFNETDVENALLGFLGT
ncbi:hypothetical protein BU24DRAFT_10762 [Aaosphaeria arxii CBS 175.79]|uniref:Uncharacterized protein n=1 Tax=Aaosphaeria arxii CBS 175.79 TaxID=1450172 RepID=A0A6A5Y7X7_9PLEO|nr:uncharacterized protein BU24DRAFT_10762 [Aaosphaeria arxii CBS 175.79]KAF2020910.1 hypothetical protein BU24DRAFT_10762 [Aaosphaeria arxii CBS 175.79]